MESNRTGSTRKTSGSLIALAVGAVCGIAGCALGGPGSEPIVSWFSPATQVTQGNLTVALDWVGQQSPSKYRTQYLQNDVQDFVIGLFNASTSTQRGNLGYEYWNNGGSLATTSIAFGALGSCGAADDAGTTPIFLGTMSGCNQPDLMTKTNGGYPNGLTNAQMRDATRWLLVRRNAALDNLTKSTTFSNLAPGTNYYLFAEAFLLTAGDSTAATESNVAGVATMSVVVNANQTTSATLPLTLNYNEGGVAGTVNTTVATPSGTAI